MNGERLEVLKDNEKFIARGGKDESEDDSDEAIDAEGDDEDFDSDSEEEWKKQQKIFQSVGAKLHTGKPLTADEMKEFAVDEDDENDSDYEFNGGDMSLYDSRIDNLDELEFLKNTLS